VLKKKKNLMVLAAGVEAEGGVEVQKKAIIFGSSFGV
jgi:hypothetical protein